MAINDSYFTPPALKKTSLQARGFDEKGNKSGGINNPAIVDVPVGALLIRFYHDPKFDYGAWWATAAEVAAIVRYFGRGGPAFGVGRTEGKGILHATFAVRHDWSRGTMGAPSPKTNSSLHLGAFIAARIAQPLKAFHGEGDPAPDGGQSQVQKGIKITDASGRQRGGRQLFIPDCWNYKTAFVKIDGGLSDADLLKALATLKITPLSFER